MTRPQLLLLLLRMLGLLICDGALAIAAPIIDVSELASARGGSEADAEPAAAAAAPIAEGAARAAPGPSAWQRVLLTDAAQKRGAVCLDGSPGGYFIRRGDPSRWILFMQVRATNLATFLSLISA